MSWWTEIGDVVQFNEKHDWRGVIGIITEIKQIDGGDIKYRIGVPMLNGGVAYIYSLGSATEFEYIGKAALWVDGEIIGGDYNEG